MASRSVLIIDRDANARTALAELLGDAGYDVRSADSTANAQRLIGSARPCAVLAEMMHLQDENRTVRAWLTALVPEPRLIFMVTMPPKPSLFDVEFVRKPIDLERLLETLAAEPNFGGEARTVRRSGL